MLSKILLLFICLWFPLVVTAQKVVILSEQTDSYAIFSYTYYCEDSTKQLSIADVAKPTFRNKFKLCQKTHFNKGLVNKDVNYWLRVELKNTHPYFKQWVIDLHNPLLDYVTFYVSKTFSNDWVSFQAGDNIPLALRSIRTRVPTLDVQIPQGETKVIYIKIETEGILRAPLFVSHAQAFFQNSIDEALFFGFLLGLLGLFSLVTLSSWLYTRGRLYLYLTLFLGFTILLFLQINGYASTYLYPASYVGFISNHILLFIVFWSMLSLILFHHNLLNISTEHWLGKLKVILVVFYITFPLLFFSLSNNFVIIANLLIVIFTRFYLVLSGIFTFQREKRYLYYYTFVAYGIAIIGLLSYFAFIFDWLVVSYFQYYVIESVALLEAGFWGLALIYKNSYNYKKMQQTEQDALYELRKSKANLEKLVQERTAEIAQALQALQEQEKIFRNLVETMQAGVLIHQEFKFKYVNNFLANMLGYTIEELYQKNAVDLMHPEHIALIQEYHTKRMRNEYAPNRYDIKVLHKKGHALWLDLSITKIEYKGQVATLGTVYDITDKKHIYEKLAQQNVALEQTIRNQDLMQHQLVESAKMSALGKLIANVAHELNTPLAAINSSVQSLQRAIERITQDLQPILQQLSPSKRVVFFDLLSQLSFEEKNISLQEKRRIKEEWIMILHENKIPHTRRVAEILMNVHAELNIKQLMPLLKHKNHLEIFLFINNLSNLIKSSLNIRFASEQASKTVIALKTYSRQEKSTEKTYINLRQNLETVLALHKHHIKHGVEVVLNISEDIMLNCYADEITQVWSNIVNNALQAMNFRGRISITAIEKGDKISVVIQDSGAGIPPEVQPHIFEPFFTTKPVGIGNGLGLDIVKKIVEKHDGKIYFTTEVNKGTTFFIDLPR